LVKITQPFLAFKKDLEMVKGQLRIPIYLICLSTSDKQQNILCMPCKNISTLNDGTASTELKTFIDLSAQNAAKGL